MAATDPFGFEAKPVRWTQTGWTVVTVWSVLAMINLCFFAAFLMKWWPRGSSGAEGAVALVLIALAVLAINLASAFRGSDWIYDSYVGPEAWRPSKRPIRDVSFVTVILLALTCVTLLR